jgi:hypothetical protein
VISGFRNTYRHQYVSFGVPNVASTLQRCRFCWCNLKLCCSNKKRYGHSSHHYFWRSGSFLPACLALHSSTCARSEREGDRQNGVSLAMAQGMEDAWPPIPYEFGPFACSRLHCPDCWPWVSRLLYGGSNFVHSSRISQ